MDVSKYLKKKSEIIDNTIDELLPEDIKPQNLAQSSRHLIKAGGKRVRPVLTLTACGAVGGNPEDVVESAVALELLHTFTLVHDDIMDKDDFRRGVKTVHEVWDEPLAIITGDALFAKVFEAVAKNVRRLDITKEKTNQIFEIMSKTSYKVCQGQALDINFEKRENVSKTEYVEMIEKKTGALIKTSTRVGGLLGGGSQEEIEALSEYGRLVGTAFQVQDDLLEIIGEEDKAGKPIGSDIREGKWTFPAIYAYENASPAKRKELLDALQEKGGSEEETEKIINIFEETGAIDFAKRRSQEVITEAKKQLEVLPDTKPKKFLLELADFTINREI